jgi:uncharacterized protein (TIGR02271 family)
MTDTLKLALAEERLTVQKRVRAKRIRITTRPVEHRARVEESLAHQKVTITRVSINREVDAPPQPRQEGETLIIPVLEEILVVEKRLLLREEVHITTHRTTEELREDVVLRSEEVSIEEFDSASTDVPEE